MSDMGVIVIIILALVVAFVAFELAFERRGPK